MQLVFLENVLLRTKISTFRFIFVFAVFAAVAYPALTWAATAPGTGITLTATATFTDSAGTALNTTSNTVTTTVQNAPSLTVTAPGNQNVTPAMKVVDTFTLTNTGNASGAFALSGDATFAGTASAPTLLGYVLAGASSGTCSTATPCTYTTLNAQAGMAGIAINGTVTAGVEYQVVSTSTNNQTIQTTLSVNVTYAAAGSAGAETSANVTATPTDTVKTDARLDVQASGSSPGSSGANITWTITANDGGGYAANNLLSAKTMLGAGAAGIAIFIPTPSYNSTYLTLQAQPSAPTLSGATSGATSSVYYNATACASSPTTGWSATYSASAKCLALYVSGGTGGNELPSATGGSSGAGAVTTAQITFSFTTNQPSGNGSANGNSVTMVATGAIGGTAWATGTTPILGQGVTMGTADAATASLVSGIESNVTSSSGTTAPGGASNSAGSQAFAAYSVVNGPYNNAGATGSYPAGANVGAGAASNALDFEALSVACTNNGGAGVNGSPCTVGTNIVLVNTMQNTGNLTDTINLKATAPTGWKVQLYNASACSSFTSCTQGASITSQSTDGGNVNGNVSVASGATLNYEAVYNATGNSTTPFAVYDTTLTAAGQSGSGTGSDTNDTHNDLYPGGVTKLTASVNVTSTNCPAGESSSPPAGTVCPGGVLGYSIAYANIVPAATSTNLGTEPSFAYAVLNGGAGGLVITCDGGASGNAWATNTFGLNAAPSDTTANTTYVYTPNIAFASGTYPSITAGPTKYVATVGGASGALSMGGSGTISFNVTVK